MPAGLTATLRSLRLIVAPTTVRFLYQVVSTRNYFTTSSLYLNLGYWRDARTLDEAAERMAHEVGARAGLGTASRLLDCGFGFADQDILWARSHPLLSIDGVNIVPEHVTVGAARVREAGLSGRVRLQLASATALPFAHRAFDRVIALESAFHFDTREAFFHEAARVLAPGGVLVTADIVPRAGAPAGPRSRLVAWSHRRTWQVPRANLYGIDTYVAKLRQAGFADVVVESIREDVFGPFLDHAVRYAEGPAGRRFDPVLRYGPRIMRALGWFDPHDYILVTARR